MQGARDVHAPSMRPGLSRTWTASSAEDLIKQAYAGDGDEPDDDVERLAERLAGGNRQPDFRRYQTS